MSDPIMDKKDPALYNPTDSSSTLDEDAAQLVRPALISDPAEIAHVDLAVMPWDRPRLATSRSSPGDGRASSRLPSRFAPCEQTRAALPLAGHSVEAGAALLITDHLPGTLSEAL